MASSPIDEVAPEAHGRSVRRRVGVRTGAAVVVLLAIASASGFAQTRGPSSEIALDGDRIWVTLRED